MDGAPVERWGWWPRPYHLVHVIVSYPRVAVIVWERRPRQLKLVLDRGRDSQGGPIAVAAAVLESEPRLKQLRWTGNLSGWSQGWRISVAAATINCRLRPDRPMWPDDVTRVSRDALERQLNAISSLEEDVVRPCCPPHRVHILDADVTLICTSSRGLSRCSRCRSFSVS